MKLNLLNSCSSFIDFFKCALQISKRALGALSACLNFEKVSHLSVPFKFHFLIYWCHPMAYASIIWTTLGHSDAILAKAPFQRPERPEGPISISNSILIVNIMRILGRGWDSRDADL